MPSLKEAIESRESAERQTVQVGMGDRSYEIRIARDLLDRLGEETSDLLTAGAPAVVVTNDNLAELYGAKAIAALEPTGAERHLCVVPDGETHKTMATLGQILDFLVERKCPRQTTLYAVGGGVIGDMAGFAAAIYLRGISYVQVPTSSLAMVDASVGGKTAVDHPMGKNLIGAFHQPRRVVMDLSALDTQPVRAYRAGLAEIIKHGVIRDAELFEVLEKEIEALANRDPLLLAPIIRRNCEIKAAVVEADEREAGLRAILNFGHTLGHGVENLCFQSGMLHGEAVSIGMAGASLIACKMGLWSGQEHQRLKALLQAAKLPVAIPPLDTDALKDRMLRDKKVFGKKLRFVLPVRIGEVEIRDDVPESILLAAIEEMKD
jgi:3-dehydroquinate synthase